MTFPIFSVLVFIVGMIISTIIIYIVARIFGEKVGIGRALLAAVIGSAIYTVAYHIFGTGWLAAI